METIEFIFLVEIGFAIALSLTDFNVLYFFLIDFYF